jgi:F-type H+-transporting ATPase subunit delta
MAELATVARPYAQALFSIESVNPRAAVAWIEELAVLSTNPQLRMVAGNPVISSQQIYDLIIGVAQASLDEKARNFLRIIVNGKRLLLLPEIAKQYAALVAELHSVRTAVVHSAFPMQEQDLTRLQVVLEKKFGSRLELQVHIDASLIGGVRVLVGDEVFDISVKASLEQMKAALIA